MYRVYSERIVHAKDQNKQELFYKDFDYLDSAKEYMDDLLSTHTYYVTIRKLPINEKEILGHNPEYAKILGGRF